jgi:hypothetical protein
MAVLVGKVTLHEPVAMDIDVQVFNMDGVAHGGACSFKEGGPIGFYADIGTIIYKAGSSVCGSHKGVVQGG